MRGLVTLALVVACGSPSVPERPMPVSVDAAVATVPAPAAKTERWAGTLVLPHVLVDIVVHFTESPAGWTATLDVPAAKLAGLALTDVTLGADAIAFVLDKQGRGANEHYTLQRTGATATGSVRIGTQPFRIEMRQLAPGEAPRRVVARPQTPQPPFPYESREVEIAAPEAGRLAGTLTLPSGTGPFPAVLLISGSGQQDRDETLFGHKPFAVIADRLTREGLAVLRTDDRGVGKTTGAIGSLDTEIGDARAAFEWLIAQPSIDPRRAGILGHSLGATIAPFVAARTRKVAFIVALAGPAFSGVELVPMQLDILLRAQQLPEPLIRATVEGQRKTGAAIATGDVAKIKAALRAVALETAAAAGRPRPSDEELEASIAAKLAEITNPWIVSYFKTDPLPAWKQMKGPVLAVIGDKDTQVPADANLARLAAALKAAKHRDVTTEKRPGLNHLFQHASTGMPDEYGAIEETFDPATLELITRWVVDRTRKR